jgi:DNA polymerase delta subunit 1
MVTFADAYDVQTCGVRGEEASVFVTDHFASLGYPQMILEFEKCYFPYFLQGKKRYAGLKYEPSGGKMMQCKGIDCKGIETERKDTLPFVKDIMHGCLDALMYQKDEQLALEFFHSKMRDFVNGQVEFDKFIMKKNLSAKAEKKPDQLVQAHVNALRRAREPGSESSINEQVEYVIINGHKKEKTTQLAEDPKYAKSKGLKLNLLWYFEHAIREPVKKIFDVFETIDFNRICKDYSAELNSKRLGVSNMLREMMMAGSTSQDISTDSLPPRKRYKHM